MLKAIEWFSRLYHLKIYFVIWRIGRDILTSKIRKKKNLVNVKLIFYWLSLQVECIENNVRQGLIVILFVYFSITSASWRWFVGSYMCEHTTGQYWTSVCWWHHDCSIGNVTLLNPYPTGTETDKSLLPV